MKKLFTLLMLSAITTSVTLGATSEWNSFKKAVRTDLQDTHNAVKESVRKDIEADRQARTNAYTSKKTEKINEINARLAELYKEKAEIQNDKDMTYTEKTLRTRSLDRRINFYNKQKASL